MLNNNLLVLRNHDIHDYPIIQKKIIFRNNSFIYHVKTYDGFFDSNCIYEILTVINYVIDKYPANKIPIHFYAGDIIFEDKLVYIILESICYYMLFERKHYVSISFKAKHSIFSEGIRYSPLTESDPDRFIGLFQTDYKLRHFRKIFTYSDDPEQLSKTTQDILYFLKHAEIDEETSLKLTEVLSELIGNAIEHGKSDCLIDIDLTDPQYIKTNDPNTLYAGLNAIVLNYSSTLFYEPIKEKLLYHDIDNMPERYKQVKNAYDYHKNYFDDDYTESDFMTITSFQHRISGSRIKTVTGGTGLTSLIHALELKADSSNCYMISGDRVLVFKLDNSKIDSADWFGFNCNNNYLTDIPEKGTFSTSKVFIPGIAYNLNFAVDVGERNER